MYMYIYIYICIYNKALDFDNTGEVALVDLEDALEELGILVDPGIYVYIYIYIYMYTCTINIYIYIHMYV